MFGVTLKAESAADFLNFPTSARSIGMGEAFSTFENDIDTVSYNPAGIVSLKGGQFSLMHMEWLETIAFEHISYGHSIKGHAFALDVSFLHLPTFIHFGSRGEKVREFNIYDLAFGLTYGRKILGVETGINLKYIYRTLGVNKASAFAGDFGFIKRLSLLNFSGNQNDNNFSIGISMRNLGTKIRFLEVGDSLPLTFGIGFGYKPIKDLSFGLDLNKPTDIKGLEIRTGTEYILMDRLFLRGGYQINETSKALSAGGGIKQRIGKVMFYGDYAFRFDLEKTFKGIHAFSLKIGF